MELIHSVHMDNKISNWVTKYEKIDVHIIVFVVEGKVAYRVNEERFIAEQGEIVIIPVHFYRSGRNFQDKLHTKYAVLLQDHDSPLIKNFFLKEQRLIKFKLNNYQAILRKFEQLYDEYLNQDRYYDLISSSIVQEMFVLIARELEKPEVAPMKVLYVEMIKEYIMKNLQQKIEIEQLAQLINKSPNYTITIFREVVGCSPIVYIHQLRLIEAGNLLLNSDMSITDISAYLGYYDTSYFNRMFRRYTSLTPTQFKQKGKPLLLANLKK